MPLREILEAGFGLFSKQLNGSPLLIDLTHRILPIQPDKLKYFNFLSAFQPLTSTRSFVLLVPKDARHVRLPYLAPLRSD